MRLGIDTGGTFTDFVLEMDGRVRLHKVLSTPSHPERAILQGIRELGLDPQNLQIVHGSTVATNAVLERKGAKTLYISNTGFADILTLARQNRRELYNLQAPLELPPVPRKHCLEVPVRRSAEGRILEELSDESIAKLRSQVVALRPEAIAINLLFSYLNGEDEQRLHRALADLCFVSISSSVLPEIKEYERGMATWLNAYVGPRVQGYLQRLQSALKKARIQVMQSSGRTMDASEASNQAVRMLLSGPAGGLVAAKRIGEAVGLNQMLTFDMGGTSTDVGLIDGDIRLTSEAHLADWPVAVPMVDMHTIGAGGGSIALLDEGGMLRVGPESAGADPGPACYGSGGQQITVTDANVVLGRLPAHVALGGSMSLHVDKAVIPMSGLAERAGMDVYQMARGIIEIANEHMAQALRVISIEKGLDPSDYVLMCFGGAGGLHVCGLAQLMGIKQAMVPAYAGVFSAAGMLLATPGRDLVKTYLRPLEGLQRESVEMEFAAMEADAEQAMLADSAVSSGAIQYQRRVDLRYIGQSFTLTVDWQTDLISDFAAEHMRRYGHCLHAPVELVNLRLSAFAQQPALWTADFDSEALCTETMSVPVYGEQDPVPVFRRQQLTLSTIVNGPAVIAEEIGTLFVDRGWSACLDKAGNLRLNWSDCADV